MTDFTVMGTWLAPIASVKPLPVDEPALRDRLRLTAMGVGLALLGLPVALVLGILSILAVPLTLALAGLAIAWAVVPATEWLAGMHRRVSGGLLDEEIPSGYVDTAGTNAFTLPFVWLRDPARWRDAGFLWFSATGGFVLSALPALLLTAPVVHVAGAILDGGLFWWLLVLLDGPLLVVWWLITPHLARARALAERGILGHSLVEQLERRVEEVTASRSETLDHSAAEVRRIERDLHDGAQARMIAVGMHLGMAEKLVASDPDAAAETLRQARQTTLSALADMRALIKGIHPPALADHGLAGGIEALAFAAPIAVSVAADVPGHPPAAVESALYFAVAECLTNVVKHGGATRAWVRLDHHEGVLRAVVGDDGHGGADPNGSGLTGVARRLSAFDGTMAVSSPAGGPTVVTMEVPCALSSQRTRPSSAAD
jgi:signal transduction histidine kinase